MHPAGRTEIELRINFEALASSEAAGVATSEEIALLEASKAEWIDAVRRLLAETEVALRSAEHITGPERDWVLDDLASERRNLRDALSRLTGVQFHPAGTGPGRKEARGKSRPDGRSDLPEPVEESPVPPALQGSWQHGRLVVWAGSRTTPAAPAEERDRLIADAGAAGLAWEEHPGVTVPGPGGGLAPAVSVPLPGALGWLVGVGAGQLGADAAPSLHWLGEVTVWATELAAQGRMIPSLVLESGSGSKARGESPAQGRQGSSKAHHVKWVPAALDTKRLRRLAGRMPGAVATLEGRESPERLCRSVLGAAIDLICRAGAARLVAAATVPVARTKAEVTEAVLAGFAGAPFQAAPKAAVEVAESLDRWASPVTGHDPVALTVRLDAPDDAGGWRLAVEATGIERHPLPIEEVLAARQPSAVSAAAAKGNKASVIRGRQADAQLQRLERLVPALQRPGRRGQAILDGAEAWDFMTATGPVLAAAGFGVKVPALSPRKASTRLAMQAEAMAGPTSVGLNQLSDVRWSVLIDGVELDAAAIHKLAAQSRPLVRGRDGWVEVDKADLDAAAKALAERAMTTRLSGAAILRHAVGLEGGALGGAVVVDGSGWAVDIVRGAAAASTEPLPAPPGFDGELRRYQAEARGWLGFLDRAGLGGCLAMDMGLGKTPTILAHVLATRGEGPALVIAPPAVLGNWAAEAAKFTPELEVHTHHGASRASADDVAAVAAGADIVLTTYATAVRDVEALATISWDRIIVDEAQAIKNPASDTAQQLRRLNARCKVALTGTPVENGLSDLWSILDFTNPGLVGGRPAFVEALSGRGDGNGSGSGGNGSNGSAESALRALNGLLVFRRTKMEPEIAAELPDKIDELDHCGMTPEQVGLYQAVLDKLIEAASRSAADAPDPAAARDERKGQVLAAITALKQICDHPAAYIHDDDGALDGRSGKLTRLEELVDAVFSSGERMLVFTHFARWGEKLAAHLTKRTGTPVACYHGGLTRLARDRIVKEFQELDGPGVLVLSIKAGGTGLNLTAANHVVLYDRWWNPAVEDQARDRSWRIGQTQTVISHRLVCPGTVDERVEEIVAGKRKIADLVLPASSSLGDLDAEQLRVALGLRPDAVLEPQDEGRTDAEAAA